MTVLVMCGDIMVIDFVFHDGHFIWAMNVRDP